MLKVEESLEIINTTKIICECFPVIKTSSLKELTSFLISKESSVLFITINNFLKNMENG